jgi:hypothetical protein
MDTKPMFLIKNISNRDGIYCVSASEGDRILRKGEQLYLDHRPLFNSVEIKVVEMKK